MTSSQPPRDILFIDDLPIGTQLNAEGPGWVDETEIGTTEHGYVIYPGGRLFVRQVSTNNGHTPAIINVAERDPHIELGEAALLGDRIKVLGREVARRKVHVCLDTEGVAVSDRCLESGVHISRKVRRELQITPAQVLSAPARGQTGLGDKGVLLRRGAGGTRKRVILRIKPCQRRAEGQRVNWPPLGIHLHALRSCRRCVCCGKRQAIEGRNLQVAVVVIEIGDIDLGGSLGQGKFSANFEGFNRFGLERGKIEIAG